MKRLIIRNELRLHSNEKKNICAKLIGNHKIKLFQNHSIDWVWNKLIENFRLVVCNKELKDNVLLSTLNLNDIFNLKVRIVGGKGGFGATMRSQKPKNPMTTNFDACRDLSGRRLRNVNAIRQLEEWQKKKAEEEKKIEEEVKDYQENQKQIHAAIHANTYKIDDKYKKQIEISTNNISNSVQWCAKNDTVWKKDPCIKNDPCANKRPPVQKMSLANLL